VDYLFFKIIISGSQTSTIRIRQLKDVWHKFQLDWVNFRFKIRGVAGLDYRLLLFIMRVEKDIKDIFTHGEPSAYPPDNRWGDGRWAMGDGAIPGIR
jgi:hypothetical protein